MSSDNKEDNNNNDNIGASDDMNQVYVITGACGFIGTWIIQKLITKKKINASNIYPTDLKLDLGIWEQVLDKDSISIISKNGEFFDITNYDKFSSLLTKCQSNNDNNNNNNNINIIHLAGLQVPTCRARPILGATVNVIGTLTVFEAIKDYNNKITENNKNNNNNKNKSGARINNVVYASSAGVCGPSEDYLPAKEVSDKDFHKPHTHYGYFKLCNEGNAYIYWQDHGISSIGLRPLTVFGVGRELGVTSDVTKAIKACVLNEKYEMRYKGNTLFHYVEDIAELFIDCCNILNDNKKHGAYTCNIKGTTLSVEKFLEIIFNKYENGKKLINFNKNAFILPFPNAMKQETLDNLFENGNNKYKLKGTSVTPIMDAIYRCIEIFEKLKKENRLYNKDLKMNN